MQEELSKRGLDTKWNPLRGKKELCDRLGEHLAKRRAEVAEVDAAVREREAARAAAEAAQQQLKEAQEVSDAC